MPKGKEDEREEKRRVRKNEKARRVRDMERVHLDRIGFLFRPPPMQGTWKKWELLTLGKIISLSMDAADYLPNSLQSSSSFSTVPGSSPTVSFRFGPPYRGRRSAWAPLILFITASIPLNSRLVLRLVE